MKFSPKKNKENFEDNGKSEKMQIRRPGTKGYEEVDGTINVSIPQDLHQNGIHGDTSTSHMASPEFELASVSVVPDGKI